MDKVSATCVLVFGGPPRLRSSDYGETQTRATLHDHLSICKYTVTEKAASGEIRIGVDANWVNTPTEKDEREFYDHIRKIAGERGKIEEFSHADRDRFVVPPAGATDRFVETGDAGIPTEPVGEFDSMQSAVRDRYVGKRTCLQCGSKIEELNPTLWVCPACKLLQFQQDDGTIQTRYPVPVRVTGEEDEPL